MELDEATEQLIEAVCAAAELSEAELDAMTAAPLLYQQLLARLPKAAPDKPLLRFSADGQEGCRLRKQTAWQ